MNSRCTPLIEQKQLDFMKKRGKMTTNVLGLGLFHSEGGFIFRTTYDDVTGVFLLSAGGFGSRNYEINDKMMPQISCFYRMNNGTFTLVPDIIHVLNASSFNWLSKDLQPRHLSILKMYISSTF